jgi:hypothetical protein
MLDAAEHCVGAVVYIGTELRDGSYSCRLLTSKSRISEATIPRNELTALLLLTELMYIVKAAMLTPPDEILYLTDSVIALSWCQNEEIKLRQFVMNRVQSVRRVIQWTIEDDNFLPIYHVPGTQNLADLLTKEHPLDSSTVDMNSPWQQGWQWMCNPTCNMPIKSYENIVMSAVEKQEMSKECAQKPFVLVPEHEAQSKLEKNSEFINLVHTVLSPPIEPAKPGESVHSVQKGSVDSASQFVDFIALGWNRAIRILVRVIKYCRKVRHEVHRKKIFKSRYCMYCRAETQVVFETQELTAAAERAAFWMETKIIIQQTQAKDLKDFSNIDGVLSHVGRLDQANRITIKDVDFDIFLDNKDFTGFSPVVRAISPLFFSYLMNVHLFIKPHAGREITVREVLKKMYIVGPFRHIVKQVREDCSTCTLISKKTVELELARHHETRTMVAPVFYSAQMDVVYGFSAKLYKGSRKTTKLYALILVCLHTAATNALALEAIDTQSVVNAIERHAARYGMPAELYVDAGSQLAVLDKFTFSIRDVDAILYDARGIRVFVATPKAHVERGRVEHKVKMFRQMLSKHEIKGSFSFTPLEWETIFAKMTNTLDDIPLAKGNSSNVADLGFEILTPNKLKLGRNNYRSVHIDGALSDPALPSMLLDRNRKVMSLFFQTLMDRLHFLQYKPNKWKSSDERLPLKDDIVIFKYNESNSGLDWKVGKVISADGRKAEIQYITKTDPKAKSAKRSVFRSYRDMSILFSEKDTFINSNQYFSEISKN